MVDIAWRVPVNSLYVTTDIQITTIVSSTKTYFELYDHNYREERNLVVRISRASCNCPGDFSTTPRLARSDVICRAAFCMPWHTPWFFWKSYWPKEIDFSWIRSDCKCQDLRFFMLQHEDKHSHLHVQPFVMWRPWKDPVLNLLFTMRCWIALAWLSFGFHDRWIGMSNWRNSRHCSAAVTWIEFDQPTSGQVVDKINARLMKSSPAPTLFEK